jgi:hypothetical protein
VALPANFRSRRTKAFRQLFDDLPEEVQRQAQRAYLLFKQDPAHPSLGFKAVITAGVQAYSVEIGAHYRALGTLRSDTIYWYWIGSHEAYNKVVKRR